MNRFALPAIFVLALIPFFIIGLQHDPSELPSPFLGNPAPEFDLPSLTMAGERVGNASFDGRMALINIWATWCVGCREEHDFLMWLSENSAVPIYGINWRDNRNAALGWLQQYGDPYVDSGFDQDGRAGIDWGAYGAPETFLVDANGIVIHKHIGPLDEFAWERDFLPLIDDSGASP